MPLRIFKPRRRQPQLQSRPCPVAKGAALGAAGLQKPCHRHHHYGRQIHRHTTCKHVSIHVSVVLLSCGSFRRQARPSPSTVTPLPGAISLIKDRGELQPSSQGVPGRQGVWSQQRMDPMEPISIAVIGGGIGGLGAAVSLQRAGLSVKVYERDRWFDDRKQGYGLTLINNPKGPLAHLGLLADCVARDCASTCHYVFNPHGDVLGYYGTAFKQRSDSSSSSSSSASAAPPGAGAADAAAGEAACAGAGVLGTGCQQAAVCRGNLRVPRQDLRQMLLDQLQPGTVQWGWRLLDYEERPQQQAVQMLFEAPVSDGYVAAATAAGGGRAAGSMEQRTVVADMVLGADGLRSVVRRIRDERLAAQGAETSPLRYVGVSVILGITTADHPLINQRGFYVLDGTHRLFTMPFREPGQEPDAMSAGACGAKGSEEGGDVGGVSGEAPSCSNGEAGRCSCGSTGVNRGVNGGVNGVPASARLTMWQLSFSDVSEEQGLVLRTSSPAQLLEEAARRTSGWMEPVPDMVRLTPHSEVWGTPLYDRDPMCVFSKRSGGSSAVSKADSRVTLLGDACHPMSMFKGQGANQALEDGPLLASWLSKAGLTRTNLPTRLRCFEREMVSRAASKVYGSREAAEHLHSPAVMGDRFGIEGVTGSECDHVLQCLRARGIGARAAGDLDGCVRDTIANSL